MSGLPPRLVLLPDSGPGVGLGHVSRCVALGAAAAALGARVSILAGGDAGAAALVRAAGLETLAVAGGVNGPAAIERLAPVGVDVVVVDSYRASPDQFVALRAVAAQVIAVDDLADRPLPVDVVVNGGVAAETLPYHRVAGTRFLLGPRYALLDARYAQAPAPRGVDRVSRVLLSLGGGRHEGELRLALVALGEALDGDVRVDVAGGRGDDVPLLATAARASRQGVTIHTDVAGLRELIEAADMAVSGAGMTLYELCASATPTVMMCMADNQRPNFEGFERAGAALGAAGADEAELGASLRAALGRLATDGALRAALGARGRALVDGQGAQRVARTITAPVVSPR
jgi:spore coat polysaccharide biosynthesis predicted glycosyltransferase SpsG